MDYLLQKYVETLQGLCVTVTQEEWNSSTNRMKRKNGPIEKWDKKSVAIHENVSSVTQKEILKRGAHSETIIKRYRDLVSQLHKKWGTAPMRTWTDS